MLGPLRARLTRAADLLRALGLRRSFRILPAWLLLRREFIAVAWPVPARPPEVPDQRGGQCTILDETGLAEFVAGCPELTAGEVRRRWAAGMECLVLWQDRAVAAYRWDVVAAAGALYVPYLGRIVGLLPGDVLTYEARTLPASRRRHLGAGLVAAAAERARRRGDRRHVGFLAAWNHASLRWADRLGWRRIGSVGYRRAGLRRRYFATGAMTLVGREIRFLPPPEPGQVAVSSDPRGASERSPQPPSP